MLYIEKKKEKENRSIIWWVNENLYVGKQTLFFLLYASMYAPFGVFIWVETNFEYHFYHFQTGEPVCAFVGVSCINSAAEYTCGCSLMITISKLDWN